MYRKTLATAVAALALTALPAPPAAAGPGDQGVAALVADLRTLHRETGAAAEVYNEMERRLREQHVETVELTERLAETRGELAEAKRLAGAVAREQYRRGNVRLPSYLRLLLGEDPARSLHAQTAAARGTSAQAEAVKRLAEAERHADELATAAREALDSERSLTEERRRQRDEVHRRLDEAAGLVAGLSDTEVAELAALEEERLLTPGG
ncbi:hypothetical protein [Streptomyces sp. SBT349]|uniref:hypothetical protein n=1 Tax=Streptomyces sp. SBT349 TaxID=1580539 RepID=UPI00069F5E99|nr:hypothetical protein [Streptomyces sp. SBT349]